MSLPPYIHFPVLISEDLILRNSQAKDIPQLLPISYYDGKKAETEAEAAEMLQKIHMDYIKGDSIHWIIEDKSSREITGTCGYYRGLQDASGELGCVLLPAFRGKGYMTKAMSLAISFGFDTIGLKKIFAETSSTNFGAINLLVRLHFRRTGETAKEVTYEITREEYEDMRP
ncbi:GNAT family N-acetyltransferase [Salinimicrobium xinjiangense]|uniref:GNAT family N-acetyltransferase n=1 Tax=Salinimicrobium xinjiangense TaxID=438596 RepID=UPI000409F72E|nr:GNAT family N-acetyltransferase [Salinimicrobium xinjiangense]